MQTEGGEGGIMKSSGPLVEEATAPASQHSLTLYRWRHAGMCQFAFKSGSGCSLNFSCNEHSSHIE